MRVHRSLANRHHRLTTAQPASRLAPDMPWGISTRLHAIPVQCRCLMKPFSQIVSLKMNSQRIPQQRKTQTRPTANENFPVRNRHRTSGRPQASVQRCVSFRPFHTRPNTAPAAQGRGSANRFNLKSVFDSSESFIRWRRDAVTSGAHLRKVRHRFCLALGEPKMGRRGCPSQKLNLVTNKL
jgi:hypothetical protein